MPQTRSLGEVVEEAGAFVAASVLSSPCGGVTCECVFCSADVLHDHPGVVLPRTGRALVVGATVLQDVLLDFVIVLWQLPHYGDCVVIHPAFGYQDLRRAGDCGTEHGILGDHVALCHARLRKSLRPVAWAAEMQVVGSG